MVTSPSTIAPSPTSPTRVGELVGGFGGALLGIRWGLSQFEGETGVIAFVEKWFVALGLGVVGAFAGNWLGGKAQPYVELGAKKIGLAGTDTPQTNTAVAQASPRQDVASVKLPTGAIPTSGRLAYEDEPAVTASKTPTVAERVAALSGQKTTA